MAEPEPLQRVAELFGLTPDSVHFLRALTHPSYAHEQTVAGDNQRLEFLGDAILDFCASETLYNRFDTQDEGHLTRTRAQLVNAEALAAFARHHQLSEALRLGRGATAGGLSDSTNVLADAVEALLAAAYLDGGLDVARVACAKIVDFGLERIATAGRRDPKSALQEHVQSLGFRPPAYRVSNQGGPAHDTWFEVEVTVGGKLAGRGRGRSKRLAERAAAVEALAQGNFDRNPEGAPSEEGAPSGEGTVE